MFLLCHFKSITETTELHHFKSHNETFALQFQMELFRYDTVIIKKISRNHHTKTQKLLSLPKEKLVHLQSKPSIFL